jgi:hypothetical protein
MMNIFSTNVSSLSKHSASRSLKKPNSSMFLICCVCTICVFDSSLIHSLPISKQIHPRYSRNNQSLSATSLLINAKKDQTPSQTSKQENKRVITAFLFVFFSFVDVSDYI